MLMKYLGSVPYRIFCAVNGITATFKSELAFKMEVLGIPVVIAVLYFCPWPFWKKMLQFCAYLWILHSEITNSAIEKVNDAFSKKEWHEMTSKEKRKAYNPLIKKSKDMASSAVLIAIIVNALIFIAFCDSEGMLEFLL